MIAKTPTMTKGRGHKPGCPCRWCQPDYLKKPQEEIVGRSAPCLAVRLPQGEADAFKALCARLGEPYGAVLRREIRRLIEEDLDAQALGRMTEENQRRDKMSNATNTLTVGDLMPGSRTSGANCWVYFDPEAMKIYGSTSVGNGTPMRAWHGVDLCLGKIPVDVASTDGLEEALSNLAGAFAELASEHDVRWDGNNHVGRLTDRGQEILESLQAEFREAVAHLPTFWDAGEWLSPVLSEIPDRILEAGSLREWARKEISIGLGEGAHLDMDDLLWVGKRELSEEADRLADGEEEEEIARLEAIKAI